MQQDDDSRTVTPISRRDNVNEFFQTLKTQRWDDHRYYHHCRINQTLHLISALSFLCAYALLFVDPAKVRAIDFKGRFFSSRGPLNTAQPPQGRPVLVQAGGSPQGKAFAARHMDVVVAALGTV
eukprot:gene30151-52248_t